MFNLKRKAMSEKKFEIRAYKKSQLAMIYFPDYSKESAMRNLREWFRVNPRLRYLVNPSIRNLTPKMIRQIVEEVGEPDGYQ